jgi:predicted Fe-S protein YdhL (DUF1289 family)
MNAIQLIAERALNIETAGHFDPKSDAPVPSPCIGVCRMAPEGTHCEGCFRTLAEIGAWSQADADARRHIWRAVLRRAGKDRAPSQEAP